MERSRRNELKKYFGEMKEPVAIVDKNLKCVYSNRPKLLPEDSSIKGVFCGNAFGLLSSPGAKPAVINGCSYSVRITPIDDELYVCDFFDLSAIIRLAENTDIYSRLFPVVDVIEFNTARLWRSLSALKSGLSEDGSGEPQEFTNALKIAADMEKRLVALSSCAKNISEYVNLLEFTPKSDHPINLVRLAKEIIKRCNTVLSNIGRCVELSVEEKELFINAQNRHVVIALGNAIQNALVYSTRDCVPVLTLSRRDNSESGEAVITLVNNSALYIAQDSGEEPGVNLVGQRLGYGIPIIKRFAELSGGTFSLREANGIFTVTIELPLVGKEVLRSMPPLFSSDGYIQYETDIPDIVELQMLEVVALLGA